MSLIHMRKPKPFPSTKEFQSILPCKLKQFNVKMNEKLDHIEKFDQKEIDLLHETINKVNVEHQKKSEREIDTNALAVAFTTQSPFTRNGIIGIAADKANIPFLPGESKLEAKQGLASLNNAISDLQDITSTLFIEKKEDTQIYNKLYVDLKFLNEIRAFISHQSRIIENAKQRLNAQRQVLRKLQDNKLKAIEATEKLNLIEKIMKYGKALVAGALFTGGTFIAAKQELISLFDKWFAQPNLIYAVVIFGALVGLLLYEAKELIRKANRGNRTIRKFEKKIKKSEDEERDFTRKILKMVGYKATKEMAASGYLESLQSEVSTSYLAAAYRGDMATVNSLYDLQVKNVFASPFSRWARKLFSNRNGVTVEQRVQTDASTSDGHVKPSE